MTTIVKVRSNGQITLPASVRRQATIAVGDSLAVRIDDNGGIHLVPQVMVDRHQAYFRTERWQAGERETDADLAAGRYQDFDSIEDMLDDLETDEE